VADDFCERYGDLLTGSYDCVDRVVLNAYFSVGHNPGGFRCWWRRLHGGSDDQLDNTHLMRFAGRFARRVKAWAAANGVPLIYCKAGQRKHLIADEYLKTHTVTVGVFLILAAKAPATVWKVHRSGGGVITNLEKKREYVYHYSFHIMDPAFGHMVIKMFGHPPFGAQVILNGHEHVAIAAQGEKIGFTKEGNCFTEIADPQRLAQVADAWPQQAAIGRLGQVCDRWIYSACLCFGLDLAEQERSGFCYGYSVYQAEYSRNLLFESGAQMEDLFDRVLDRTLYRSKIGRVSSELRIREVGYATLWYSLITPPKYLPAQHRCAGRPGEWRVVVGWSLLAGLVRAVTVVMAGVLRENRPQVPVVVDQHPVGALRPDSAHPPLGIAVGPWRPRRSPDLWGARSLPGL
jgi:hypothetical protein